MHRNQKNLQNIENKPITLGASPPNANGTSFGIWRWMIYRNNRQTKYEIVRVSAYGIDERECPKSCILLMMMINDCGVGVTYSMHVNTVTRISWDILVYHEQEKQFHFLF